MDDQDELGLALKELGIADEFEMRDCENTFQFEAIEVVLNGVFRLKTDVRNEWRNISDLTNDDDKALLVAFIMGLKNLGMFTTVQIIENGHTLLERVDLLADSNALNGYFKNNRRRDLEGFFSSKCFVFNPY
jgi:hypothetical protein